MISLQQFILFCPLFVGLLIALLRLKDTPHRRLFPGPSPVSALRDIFVNDAQHPWKILAKFGQQYGDIFQVQLWNQDVIVISSDRVAQELLGKRSHSYSSRPASAVSLAKFSGAEFTSLFLPYGDRWRLHRRLVHQTFHPLMAASFRPIQLHKAHDLIMGLLLKPQDFAVHIQLFSAAVVMAIVYGYDIAGIDDPILAQLLHVTGVAEDLTRLQMVTIFSEFPFLRYIPKWLPGSNLRNYALTLRSVVPAFINAPFEYVKKHMAAGTASPSMVSDTLSKIQAMTKSGVEAASLEECLKDVCATVNGAGAETTHSTLMIFGLAMILYPDVQARAQAEIDSVIGKGLSRLPTWEDRSSLPYVEAVVKETLRWHPTAPFGIPHAAVDDDIYRGYQIPRGATVMINALAITRDPVEFPEPETFKPERYLHENSQAVDELSFAFGYGRRVCPGRYLADASLWISIVSMLAVFQFRAPSSWDPGLNGANVKWSEGVTTRPEEVPYEITPRHENLSVEKLASLIRLAAL